LFYLRSSGLETVDSNDDLFARLMLTEPTIAKLTEGAVATALSSMSITPRRDHAWLARAVQGALYTSLTPASDGPHRQSNADTRNELTKLATQASTFWLSLVERSSSADQALWDAAFRRWDGEGGTTIDGVAIGEPSLYAEFTKTIARLNSLTTFLRQAAEEIEAQRPNWRRTEQRENRIFRAQCLSPIYEEAYGLEPTVNSWPGRSSLGPWSEFYQRIVALTFGENATPDLEGVLDEARRRDKSHRVVFAAGVIPN